LRNSSSWRMKKELTLLSGLVPKGPATDHPKGVQTACGSFFRPHLSSSFQCASRMSAPIRIVTSELSSSIEMFPLGYILFVRDTACSD
jgi:hypothetical protein